MNIHKISVSTNNYLLYENITQKTFKLHFDDYSSGVVLFRYAELDGENQNSIEVVTSNFYQEPFYFNFITSTEDIIDWHISLQKISVEY